VDQVKTQENKMVGKEAGLSLVELMVVIALIAILSAIAVPNYVAWLPKYRLSTSARDVLSDLEYARALAIKENASVVVEFDTANNSFRIWVDNGAATNADNWAQDGDEPAMRSRRTATGISLTGVDFSGENQIRFTGNGLPEVKTVPPSIGGGNVTLASKTDTRVVVLSVGGKTRIQ
jgi:prepilin-type N-terminal cleavage/methylation domain-containing protein